MTIHDESLLLTPEELADRLKITRRKVMDLDLPRYMVGREARFIWDDIVKWLESKKREYNGSASEEFNQLYSAANTGNKDCRGTE